MIGVMLATHYNYNEMVFIFLYDEMKDEIIVIASATLLIRW